MAKHELHVWFETETEHDKEALQNFAARLQRQYAATPDRIQYEVVTPDAADKINYHYCEWCWGEDRPRFGSTEEYKDHLHEVHPDEAW